MKPTTKRCKLEQDGLEITQRYKEIQLLRLVSRSEGIQRSQRLRLHRPRDQAPRRARERCGTLQGHPASLAQRPEDHPEHSFADFQEFQAKKRDHQALHPPQHHHLRLPTRRRHCVYIAPLQSSHQMSSARTRVQMRQLGDCDSAEESAAAADRQARESEEIRRHRGQAQDSEGGQEGRQQHRQRYRYFDQGKRK